MRPTDEPQTHPNQQRCKSYNTGRSCQEGVALAAQYLGEPTNEQLRERFAEHCCHRLATICSQVARRPGMCPPFLHPTTFADDVLDRAMERLSKNINNLRNPAALTSWLYKIASGAALDERKHHMRRCKEPVYWEAMERQNEEGDAIPVTDLLPEHSSSYCSTNSCEEELIRRDFVQKLVRAAVSPAAKDRDAAMCFIRHSAGLTPHELAEAKGMTRREVESLVAKGRKRLCRIAERRIHGWWGR